MPDDLRQLFAYHAAGDMFAASPGDFLIKFLHHRVIPVGYNGRLIEGDPQVAVAILVLTSVAILTSGVLSPRYQPAIT